MKGILISTQIAATLVFAESVFTQQQGGRQQPPPLPDSTQIARMVDDLAARLKLKGPLPVERDEGTKRVVRVFYAETQTRNV
jgi:hypothetical protein